MFPDPETSAHIPGMSTLTKVRPVRAATKDYRWAVSDGAYENQFFVSSSWAAAWLVDEAMRKHRKGELPELTIQVQDRFVGVLWDATSDVRNVLKATGWPTLSGDVLRLRAIVINIVNDILVSDETPHDAPFPGISDPHTYGLVCR
jgi:hypothetical protein